MDSTGTDVCVHARQRKKWERSKEREELQSQRDGQKARGAQRQRDARLPFLASHSSGFSPSAHQRLSVPQVLQLSMSQHVAAQHVAACRSSACRSMPQLSMSQLSMSQHVAACRSSACRRSAPLSSFLLSLYLSSFSLAVPSLSLALALTFVATPKMITRSEAWTREQFDFVPRRESVRGKR